ncbi:Replication factor C, subunit RFC4 [Dispira simplex]|nr:Replication factor C, subunit RFC4 [Dispira simplex]
MKILTKQEEDEAYQAHVDGGIKGGLISTAIFTPACFMLHRYWRPFRQLTLPFKAFLLTSGIASVIMIESERAGKRYEKSKYGAMTPYSIDYSKDSTKAAGATQPMVNITRPWTEEATDFVRRHQWSLVGGTWATGMGVAFTYLARQKHMSTMNKVVQARMYAQIITIAALLATAVIVGTNHTERRHINMDNPDLQPSVRVPKKSHSDH